MRSTLWDTSAPCCKQRARRTSNFRDKRFPPEELHPLSAIQLQRRRKSPKQPADRYREIEHATGSQKVRRRSSAPAAEQKPSAQNHQRSRVRKRNAHLRKN